MFSTNFSVIKMCILLLKKKKKMEQNEVEVEKQSRILV